MCSFSWLNPGQIINDIWSPSTSCGWHCRRRKSRVWCGTVMSNPLPDALSSSHRSAPVISECELAQRTTINKKLFCAKILCICLRTYLSTFQGSYLSHTITMFMLNWLFRKLGIKRINSNYPQCIINYANHCTAFSLLTITCYYVIFGVKLWKAVLLKYVRGVRVGF